MKIDKMDQKKSIIPTIWSQSVPKFAGLKCAASISEKC